MTEVAVLTPDETAKAAEVELQIAAVVAQAHELVVATEQDAVVATEVLSRIAAKRKQSEEARKFLVGPLNDHVKAINAKFKQDAEPLEVVDKLVRERLLGFQKVQEEARREEQKRLDAERQEREAAAEAQRQRAVAEAQEQQRLAEAAEARRRAELEQAADELAKRAATLTDEQLAAAAPRDDQYGVVARNEIEARKAAAEAAQAAERAAEEARAAEIAAKSAPAMELAAPTPLRSVSGAVSTRKRWTHEVVDLETVPREYLVLDTKKVNEAIRSGLREIPGLKIEQVDELSVRAS